jgi:hypothetical protein
MMVTELERMEGSRNGPAVVLSYPGMYLKKQEKVFQPLATFHFHNNRILFNCTAKYRFPNFLGYMFIP